MHRPLPSPTGKQTYKLKNCNETFKYLLANLHGLISITLNFIPLIIFHFKYNLFHFNSI